MAGARLDRRGIVTIDDDWARTRDVFEAALERPLEERTAFLDEACAGQPQRRAEVASLLAAHDASPDFLERPVFEAAGELLVDPSPERRYLGPYVIRQEIGRGGMGIVYLADDTRLSRRVALKALPAEVAHDARRRERLRHEARAAAALSHPGIATVYALEEIDDHLYLACEYVAGITLRARIASGAVPLPQVIDIGLQLAHALAAAHAHGVIHRDLKPENIILTAAGIVKILDFGIARAEHLSPAHLTAEGDALGTPGYMSPEQIRGEAVDFRADLFALGLVIYELASASNPFAGATRTETAARILGLEPPPLSQVRADAPPGLEHLVARCLQKDRTARYASTPALVGDLERLHAAIATVTPPGHRTPLPKSTAQWWWQCHQAVTSAIYALTLYPMWVARLWLPQPWATFLLLVVLVCAAGAITLRLHLWFTSRFYPSELATERSRARSWVRRSDVGLAATVLLAALAIATLHQATAMVLVAIAIGVLVASFVIEPTAARAAFDAS